MKKYLVFASFLFLFAACSTTSSLNQNYNYGVAKPNTPATMRPYTINGKTYYPSKVDIGDTETGIASWYGPGFHGKKTSNGETFNTNSMTAAHKTLPMNTMVRVDNLENGKSVVVRVNDRGPFVAGRIIDLSNRAAHEIDMTKKGTARVKLTILGFNQDNIKPQISNTNSNIQNSVNSIMGGDFMIQIGAFKSSVNAYNLAKRYANYKGYTSKVLNSSDGFYRVFLKGFRSEEEAKDFINLANFLGSFIFRE
ncbi:MULTISPECIES: septal ring lytic transglycosylase RlpA family protein [unclassified Campylobacter]|uniref:septal ring lytic transglycosylase RlpA family protein n=1 Tax=unclassified Campylobacter TaxID=2593542 RepID=UPI0030153E47